MDNRELFTRKAEDYSRFRPSYPAAAVDWLRERTVGETVADIGAGTGIFTACLRRRFQRIFAVEPNADMREKFLRALPDIPCLDGSGEGTALAGNSVDLITAAQTFHWLDEVKFKIEAQRILVPGGKVAIVWNNSLKTNFTTARDAVCREYCPRFRTGHAGKRSAADGDAFLRNGYFSEVEIRTFEHPFVMNADIFAGNMRSRSYAPVPGDENFENFMQALLRVFERYSSNGIVTELLETQIYLGRFA